MASKSFCTIMKTIGTGKTVISASRQSMIKSSMPIITRESIFTMASLPFAVMKSSSFAASLETRLISSPAVRFDMEFIESCCDFSNISCLRSRPKLRATLKLFFMLKNSNTPAKSSRVTIVMITPASPAQWVFFGVTYLSIITLSRYGASTHISSESIVHITAIAKYFLYGAMRFMSLTIVLPLPVQ